MSKRTSVKSPIKPKKITNANTNNSSKAIKKMSESLNKFDALKNSPSKKSNLSSPDSKPHKRIHPSEIVPRLDLLSKESELKLKSILKKGIRDDTYTQEPAKKLIRPLIDDDKIA
jgi:hypothetical protein